MQCHLALYTFMDDLHADFFIKKTLRHIEFSYAYFAFINRVKSPKWSPFLAFSSFFQILSTEYPSLFSIFYRTQYSILWWKLRPFLCVLWHVTYVRLYCLSINLDWHYIAEKKANFAREKNLYLFIGLWKTRWNRPSFGAKMDAFGCILNVIICHH